MRNTSNNTTKVIKFTLIKVIDSEKMTNNLQDENLLLEFHDNSDQKNI